MLLTPTYHVMELYKGHQDATMIPIHVKSGDYELGEKKLKAISASASINEAGQIHISLVNIHATRTQELRIDLRGTEARKISGQILTAQKLQAHNTFDNPNVIQPKNFKDFKLDSKELSVQLPPFSVVVLRLE